MIMTGIADEAGADIASQILAHRKLGWNAIELRCINGKNASGALSDSDFDVVADKIEQAGMTVTCFASAIGNWGRHILEADFAQDISDLKIAAKRMNRLDTKFIRTMSWVGKDVDNGQWRDEVVRRYKEMVKIAADNEIFIAHENCTGWGGLSPENMLYLHDAINSEHFMLLFDTGNPVAYGSDAWEFYIKIKDLIRYVHIKDCRKNNSGGLSNDFTYPGKGDAMVRRILADLIASGYDGTFSIEPHVGSIIHTGKTGEDEESFASYLRYGSMTANIIESIKKELL